VDFTRLECRNILANVDSGSLDPDVFIKLVAAANATVAAKLPSEKVAIGSNAGSLADASITSITSFIETFASVAYSVEELSRIQIPYGIGFRPATQADVDAARKANDDAAYERQRRAGYSGASA
jgi:hypothetical protein